MQKYQHKNELTALNKKFQTSSYLDNSSSKKLIKERSWQKPRYKIGFQKNKDLIMIIKKTLNLQT